MDHIHPGFQMPIPPPPIINQPPQIFGGYTEHGIPIPPQLPPDLMAAQMFGDPGLLEDTTEAKRRRISRVSPSLCSGRMDPCSIPLTAAGV